MYRLGVVANKKPPSQRNENKMNIDNNQNKTSKTNFSSFTGWSRANARAFEMLNSSHFYSISDSFLITKRNLLSKALKQHSVNA